MVKKERLNILCSLATSIAVTHMADSHLTLKMSHLRLIENFSHKTFASCSMEVSLCVHCHDAATLLTTMLKCMKAIIGKTCRIFNSIDAYNSTLMMELVIPVFVVTLTHYLLLLYQIPGRTGDHDFVIALRQSCQLFATEILHGIVKERLLKTLVHDILEEVALEALCMTHLSEDLTVAAYDTLDSIV